MVGGKWQCIAERRGSLRRTPAEVMYLFEQENHLRMLQGRLSRVPGGVADHLVDIWCQITFSLHLIVKSTSITARRGFVSRHE